MSKPVRAVILVPWRSDRGPRQRLWDWTRAWWQRELPELPIFEGVHAEGLFNRSAAVNAAAAAAGPWDVAVVIDADVICDPGQVREAIALAAGWGDRLVLPFDRRHNLTPRGTQRIMNGDQGSWKRYVMKTYTQMCSSCVMIPRQLWDAVGGFDERFVGWGFEDSAFSVACETFTGQTLHKLEGELWHLYHPTAPEGRRGTPTFQANRTLSQRYHALLGDVEGTRALQRGEDVRLPTLAVRENIPRILHRVVPAESPEDSEAWWQRFGEMHPDWTLLTHRDPLDPAEWPLTSPHWDRCTSGAQLAGLVRLEALFRHGGVYVDQDVEPLRALDPLLGLHAFAGWEDANCVPDAVLGAEPEHPAIRRCLELAIRRLDKGPWESGPGVTTDVLVGRPDVLLFPPGSFYGVHYRDPRRAAKMASFEPSEQPWAFVLHHYWGSWLPAARRRSA